MGKANGSRECAPDDRLRGPIIPRNDFERWWARREATPLPIRDEWV